MNTQEIPGSDAAGKTNSETVDMKLEAINYPSLGCRPCKRILCEARLAA